jgi:hypothetical protein
MVLMAMVGMALTGQIGKGPPAYNHGPRTIRTGVVVGSPMRVRFVEARTNPQEPGRATTVTGTIHRDGVGRTRVEVDVGYNDKIEKQLVIIHDPVGRIVSIVDPASMTALQRRLSGEELNSKPGWLFPGRASRELDQGIVAGVLCRHFRVEQDSGALEVWISEELQTVVLEETRTEYEIYSWRLVDIGRDEPESKVFRVPETYKVSTLP